VVLESLLGGGSAETAEVTVEKIRDQVVKIEQEGGSSYFKHDSILATRGDFDLSATKPVKHSGGIFGFIEKLIKSKILGFETYFVEATGSGTILAGDGGHLTVIEVPEGEVVTVDQSHILFCNTPVEVTANLDGAVLSTGLIDAEVEGPAVLVVTSECDPVPITVTPGETVHVDPQCVVAWKGDLTFIPTWKGHALDLLLGRTHGEEFMLEVEGEGQVLVSPYDERLRNLERAVRRLQNEQGGGGPVIFDDEGDAADDFDEGGGGFLDGLFDDFIDDADDFFDL